MTKTEALKTFNKFCKSAPKEMDTGWCGLAWHNYVDGLYEADKITESQRDTWSSRSPF